MNPANKQSIQQKDSAFYKGYRDPIYDEESTFHENTKKAKKGVVHRITGKLNHKKNKVFPDRHKDRQSVYSGEYENIDENKMLYMEQDAQSEYSDCTVSDYGTGCDDDSKKYSKSFEDRESSGYGSAFSFGMQSRTSEPLTRIKDDELPSYESQVIVHTHHNLHAPFVINAFKLQRGFNEQERKVLLARQKHAKFMFVKQDIMHDSDVKLRNLTEYEQQLYDELYGKIAHIKDLRNIDFAKPVRIVFVDYKSLVAQHAYRGSKETKQLTALGYSLMDSKHAMTLKDNTLYVLLPNPELGNNTELQQYTESNGIFDLCVHLPDDSDIEVAQTPPNCAKNHIQVFKYAVISQLIHVLRRHYNVPKISVILIDDEEKFRSDMEHMFKRVGVDNMAIIDPNALELEHKACISGQCNNENHLFFSGGSMMEPKEGMHRECAYFPMLEASMVSPYKYNIYVTDEIKHNSQIKDGVPTLDSLKQSSDDRLGRIIGTSVFKRKYSDITLHDLFDILFMLH